MLDSTKTKIIAKLLCGIFLVNLVSCGTILYPERKGQTSGQLDPAIVVLDGIGLLFFFIPGVVAFAVDFSNGTIYLPGGKRSQVAPEELKGITEADSTTEQLEELGALVRRKSTEPMLFDSQDLQIKTIDDAHNIQALLQQHSRHIALLND